MTALVTPLAHFGHWYHSLLYLAPVVMVVVVLWWIERREKRREDLEGDVDVRPPPPAA